MKTKDYIRIGLSWALVLALCVGIFLLSAQNAEESAELSSTAVSPLFVFLTNLFGDFGHTVLRKIAHFSQFALLSFLCYNAFYQTRKKKRLSAVLPVALSILYAVSDEIHQIFVPGRACELFDMGIDALGCLTGGLCFFLLVRILLSIRKKRNTKSASHGGTK